MATLKTLSSTLCVASAEKILHSQEGSATGGLQAADWAEGCSYINMSVVRNLGQGDWWFDVYDPVQGAVSVLAGLLCHACCHNFLCIYPAWFNIRRGSLLGECQAVPGLQVLGTGCTRRGSSNFLGAALLCWGRPTCRGGQQGGAGLLEN